MFCQGISLEQKMRMMERTLYVMLHVYSGRRRQGDLQQNLEYLTEPENFDILVISIDLAVDRQRCDMVEPENQRFWWDQAASGRVVGAFQGPPCETHTIARETELEGGGGPRPLRSRQSPWGVSGLKEKELTQLSIANRLVWFSLRLYAVLVASGGLSLIEHPAEQWRQRSVSLWRCWQVKALAALPCSDLVTFPCSRPETDFGPGITDPDTQELRFPAARRQGRGEACTTGPAHRKR